MTELEKNKNIPSAIHLKRLRQSSFFQKKAARTQKMNQANGENKNASALDKMKNIGQI